MQSICNAGSIPSLSSIFQNTDAGLLIEKSAFDDRTLGLDEDSQAGLLAAAAVIPLSLFNHSSDCDTTTRYYLFSRKFDT